MGGFEQGGAFGFGLPFFLAPFVLLLALWSIFWKGLALWHSGRKGDHWWFIALLVLNTAGILELIYLFGVLKLKGHQLFSKDTNIPVSHEESK